MTVPVLEPDEAAGWWRLSWGRIGRSKLVKVSTAVQLEGHVRALRARGPVLRERPRLHTCSACQQQSPWGPTWTWYGSYLQLDEGVNVPRLCSDACRRKAKQMKLVPRNARLIENRDRG